ncbi:PRC-barrel domain-containing protein, partial [Candidatus Saccharibacteria bacterium]|nr:PRC-barrel domain-containing protein [Candidatus Saccharibacteria bacterium]
LSLHVSGKIAETSTPIIDPKTLKIVAFTLSGPLVGKDEVGDILDVKYIREFSSLGMIVNSHDDFTTREDAIRIQNILNLNFTPIGKKVLTKKGTKLGKVIDYTLDPSSFQIHQLIIQRPALKAIVDPELTISRTQITEITDTTIIVKDEEQKIRAESNKEEFIPNFVNPFRKQSFAPVQNQNPDELDKQ